MTSANFIAMDVTILLASSIAVGATATVEQCRNGGAVLHQSVKRARTISGGFGKARPNGDEADPRQNAQHLRVGARTLGDRENLGRATC